MDKSQTVCFTGPRPKDLWGYIPSVKPNYDCMVEYLIENVLPELYASGYRNFITGGAQGFDQLACEAVHKFKRLGHDVQNIIYIPCHNQEEMWKDGNSRFCKGYYKGMLGAADKIEYITNTTYTPECISARNEAMIRDSSAVVALFNEPFEKAVKSQGGTQQTIGFAIDRDNYDMYRVSFNLKDPCAYTFKHFISDDIREIKSRYRAEKQGRNELSVNNNPVKPIPSDFGTIICLDTETTGFSYDTFDELLQLAMVDNLGHEYMTYIKPDKKKSWAGAEAVNHISPQTVKDAPSARKVMEEIQSFINQASIIVGHNVTFDLNFLKEAGLTIPSYVTVWDTCTHFKEDVPSGKHKLEMAVEHYCPEFMDEYKSGAHDALTDTRATIEVFLKQYENEHDHEIEEDELDK